MISELINSFRNGDDGYLSLVDDVLHQLLEKIPFEVGFFASIHEDFTTIQHILGNNIPHALEVGKRFHIKDIYFSNLLKNKHVHVIDDARNDSRARNLPVVSELNIGSYVSAPVYLDGNHLCGAISCISPGEEKAVDDHH